MAKSLRCMEVEALPPAAVLVGPVAALVFVELDDLGELLQAAKAKTLRVTTDKTRESVTRGP
jgi:hypothetical protein